MRALWCQRRSLRIFRIIQPVILLVLALLMMTDSHVIACEPSADDDIPTRCVSWRFEGSRATPTSVVALVPSTTATPRITVTGTVRSTTTPTARVTNTLRPTDTPTPTPTDTPVPTDTPIPTDTPSPSDTPVSGDYSLVTNTPTPTDTLTPSPTSRLSITATLTATLTPSLTSRVSITATVRRTATPRLGATLTPTATATNVRRGDSPYSAWDVTENWQTLDANSIIWYKIGEETSYPLHLSIWLDAYGRGGTEFSVFSPEQTNALDVATTPKGRGSPDKSSGHDLIWTGGSPRGGVWYILVKNNNPSPVQYNLNSSYTVTDRKNCIQYWEYIGTAYTFWTRCF